MAQHARLSALWRRTRPNTSTVGEAAIVAINEHGEPVPGAWRPFTALQLFGGRRWTLSILRTSEVTGYPPAPAVDPQVVMDALDLLDGEHDDPAAAAQLLRDALRRM